MNGIVFDIQRFSIHDGPGIRTTVFLKGCRLRCRWCQNPEGLSSDRDACGLNGKCTDTCAEVSLTLAGDEMSAESVADVVERDKVFYETSGGGLTLSGGDPTVQSAFSSEVLRECRERGIHTAVETSMQCQYEDIRLLLPYTDLWLLDLKIADTDEHRRWTGKGNELIKENFEKLCTEDVQKIVRIALIPGSTATVSNVKAIAAYAASVDKSVPVELLNFNPLCRSKYEKLGREYPLSEAKMLTGEELRPLRKAVKDAGCILYGEEKSS